MKSEDAGAPGIESEETTTSLQANDYMVQRGSAMARIVSRFGY
jgi:hypothetical protein